MKLAETITVYHGCFPLNIFSVGFPEDCWCDDTDELVCVWEQLLADEWRLS